MAYRRKHVITGLVVAAGILLGCLAAYFYTAFSKRPVMQVRAYSVLVWTPKQRPLSLWERGRYFWRLCNPRVAFAKTHAIGYNRSPINPNFSPTRIQ